MPETVIPNLIGVPRDLTPHETRTPLVPEDVKRLKKLGLEVWIETGLGRSIHFSDQDYQDAGASLKPDRSEIFSHSDLILGLNPPLPEDLSRQKPESLHIAYFNPFSHFDPINVCVDKQISALSMELIPRITRAQSMDSLTSQNSLAGYVAVMLAAQCLDKVLPMMTTPAGTLQPARIFVVGAGVAGLQAIATARRLGARVEAYDLRPEASEQIQSLGARAIQIDLGTVAQSKDGYVTDVKAEQLQRQQEALKQVCARSDIIITTALVFGKKAPGIISDEMIAAMSPGSVVVDLAVENGGNVAGSVANQVVEHHGVTIIGYTNLPGRVPYHASQMYSANLYFLIKELWDNEAHQWRLEHENEIVAGAMLTHLGALVHPQVREIWKEKL